MKVKFVIISAAEEEQKMGYSVDIGAVSDGVKVEKKGNMSNSATEYFLLMIGKTREKKEKLMS